MLSCILVIEAFALIYACKVLGALVISAFALEISCWPSTPSEGPAQFLGSLCFGCCHFLFGQNAKICFRFGFFKSRSSALQFGLHLKTSRNLHLPGSFLSYPAQGILLFSLKMNQTKLEVFIWLWRKFLSHFIDFPSPHTPQHKPPRPSCHDTFKVKWKGDPLDCLIFVTFEALNETYISESPAQIYEDKGGGDLGFKKLWQNMNHFHKFCIFLAGI